LVVIGRAVGCLDIRTGAMVSSSGLNRRLRWGVFLFALLFVAGFDSMWTGKRYAYAADSASYLEMADSLYHEGRPLVTPWDASEGQADEIPQRLFPPGYPMMIAAFMPLTGDARTAALFPGRIAAICLPVLILSLFSGALREKSLALVAVYALLTPGVRGWQFLAYSDVTALAVSVLALGALARGLRLLGDTRRPMLWCAMAGFSAGSAYGIRNAGIAVLAITLVMLVESLWRRRAWRESLAVGLGAIGPLAALWVYNLRTFGQWQPYTMPPSNRAWFLNVVDWTRASFTDSGIPWQLAERLPRFVAPLTLGVVLILLILAFWRLRVDPRRRALFMLLAGYATGGAVLLILSRSRYEWGNTIDERNTLQYTWALAFAFVMAVPILCRPEIVRLLRRLGWVFLAMMGCMSVYDAWSVGTAPVEWWQKLSADPQVLQAARLPSPVYLASNRAVLFRISAGAHVRNVEIGGDDRELKRVLDHVRREAAGRPVRFLLVCDEYTEGYSACGGAPIEGVAAPVCPFVREPSPRVLACDVPP
jgi:hypothetical protein